MKRTIFSLRCIDHTWRRRTISYVCPFILALLVLSIFCSSIALHRDFAFAQDKKITAQELIARHLDAIGTPDARAKVTTRVSVGDAQFIARLGGSANIDGNTMMVSAGAKLRFGMKFPVNDYPGEDMAYDGSQAATGLLPQGRRSNLSAFFSAQPLPLREGLIGGELSTAWPFLHMDQTQPKLDYHGLKKIDGRQLHELGYRPRKGSTDLKVLLFFDPESFRHLRTKYTYEIGASIGSRENANQNTESYYTVTEDFDDFRSVDGLTLPYKYKLQLSLEGKNGSLLHDWTITLKKIEHNTRIDDPVFVIR
jgi:hypothetical protein